MADRYISTWMADISVSASKKPYRSISIYNCTHPSNTHADHRCKIQLHVWKTGCGIRHSFHRFVDSNTIGAKHESAALLLIFHILIEQFFVNKYIILECNEMLLVRCRMEDLKIATQLESVLSCIAESRVDKNHDFLKFKSNFFYLNDFFALMCRGWLPNLCKF